MEKIKNFIKKFKFDIQKNTQSKLDNDILRGIKFSFGVFIFFSIITIISYAGSHYASNILGGTFLGNYTFNSSVNFEESPLVKQRYYYLPKNDQFVVNLSSGNCVDNGDNYKCAYEPDNDGDGCPDDMARVGDACVDKWEASYDCSIYKSQSTQGSGGPITTDGDDDKDDYLWQTRNIATINGGPAVCKGVSKNNSIPYTTITQYDAESACALSGKHLIKNSEWQEAAKGTPDNGSICNIEANNPGEGTFIPSADWYNLGGNDIIYTGSARNCISDYGVYDMVGNIREFTDDLIDPVSTNIDTNTLIYGEDGFYRESIGSIYVREGNNNASLVTYIRGGNSNFNSAAGIFIFDLRSGPSDWFNEDGFRCSMNPSN